MKLISSWYARRIAPKSQDCIRVSCLAISDKIGNPYQFLMMQGLGCDPRIDVKHGAPGQWFAATRTYLRDKPNYIHYDWNYTYFLAPDILRAFVKTLLFLIDLWITTVLLRQKIVWTLHNIRFHEECPRRLERFVQKIFASRCEWIRVFSNSSITEASEYLGVPESRFRVIPEGSYVGYYPNEITVTEARRTLDLTEQDIVLLWFGYIRPYKGIEELIRVFKQVAMPNWRLIIVGSPQVAKYAQAVESLAAPDSRIKVIPTFVSEDQVQCYFNACDAVVLPFKSIQNSGSAILAMSFSKAVIAPKLGVLPVRLLRQLDLLYTQGCLIEGLSKIKYFNRKDLETIGNINFEEVERYRWIDFARLFLND